MSNTPHFRLLGVPVRLQPAILLWIPIYGPLGYAIACRRGYSQRDAIVIGLTAILLWYQTDIVHVIGHIISARISKAPMDYVKWGIMPVTGYHNHHVSPKQHIGRSLGGPIASALAAVCYHRLRLLLKPKLAKAIAMAGYIENGIITIGSFAPIQQIDGGVIYSNMRKL
jgi:hypothetical protein